jgi:plasmid stabilization system protein ParE
MKYNVDSLRRADADVRHITRWIAESSLQCAEAWLDAYEQILARLADQPDTFGATLEDPDCGVSLK